MRLGIYGGSFDPVHLGHLLLAEYCREACQLDEVWFVPAAVPPHKQDRELTPAIHRIEMLHLAIGGHEFFSVSTIEIERGGVSYTVETLTEIHQQRPDAELFFLMGADSLAELPTWKEPQEISRLAKLVVVCRAGDDRPDWNCLSKVVAPERLKAFEKCQVDMPLIGISSSVIRNRISEGQSIRYQTTRAVEKYLQTHSLYQDS